ncbi:RagB/SusD family nutrient uptake outer membrane protein [Paludibacter sp. 221]|uniref:RagB/SusD family nutrient uptake outer membrane protein n=1 Tax=Paludibacter sp. 221 TaxID=2302939 RepID=UPI0013D5BA91|nr:RagB/SusD family nutrient uptake outer membrane protein [Paludibacter sp. 221]NDV46971.1 RagB/SusD family nutrient uptake outer membrane protein [Paludibacter sp. 221]
MKTIKYIIIAFVAVLLTACSDFFGTETPSVVSEETVYTRVALTEQAIAGIYEQFGLDRSYRNRLSCGYQGMNSDIEYNSKNSGKADYAIYNMKYEDGDLSHSSGKDPWSYLTTMIERANLVIQGIETYSDLEQIEFQYFLGEALTLRAFIYLEMIKFWGDVPARFHAMDANESIFSEKVDRNVIFEQLRVDLKRASELLPWSADCPGVAKNNTGRPSKSLALGLLARNNMMYAGYALRPDFIQRGGTAPYKVQLNTQDAALRKALYEEALNACAEIIKNDDSKLQTSFEKVFKDICTDNTTYSNSEFIWEMPFANGARGQFLNYNTVKSTDALKALKNNTSGSTNAVQMIVPTFVYDFEAGDKRRDVTIAPYTWVKDNASKTVSDEAKREALFPGTPASDNRLYQKEQKISGFYLNKFRIEWMARERNGNDDGINYPIIRYADILLMFAEAEIGGVTGDVPANTTGLTGQEQFDKIRTRAGLTSKPLNMENLMEERKFEFCGEYIRKYDLMRWGKLKESLTTTMSRIAELDQHTGEFTQTGDSIYFQYKQDNSLVYTGSGLNGYVMNNVWGLRKGEVGRPTGFDSNNGWVAKNIFESSSDGRYLKPTTYMLYYDEATIDSRHYWPIFKINLASSNGALWNDYGYPND